VSNLSTAFDTTVYKVYNLWTHKMEGKTTLKNKPDRKVTIKARDVVSYRLMK
jgi:alpha-galactosidase